MQPRIVFSTHYQVDEPAYMEFLVKLCTSPVQSTYREVVEQKFTKEITARGKDFNIAAGRYAVDLARGLDLITPNNTWTDKGHLVNLIAQIDQALEFEEQLAFTLPEKLLHFRVFLEADGAALLFMARRLTGHGALLNSDTTWNTMAREMFVDTYSNYLAITNNTADRVKLRREIDRIKTKGYEGKSGSHKAFIHIQTLHRLGLVKRPDSAARIYQLPEQPLGTPSGLKILLNEVPDVPSLEKVIDTHKWLQVAARVFQIMGVRSPEDTVELSEEVLPLVAVYYQRVMSTGMPLCSLSTLIEAIQIDLLTGKLLLLSYDEALDVITAAQRKHPKDIRFHVDRRGQPAFIKLSDDMVSKYFSKKVSA
jgi:hypothetical protein